MPDVDELARRASEVLGREIGTVERLPGGTSSLTYAARDAAGDRVVLKVAPPGLPPVRNRDVLRQARVLQTLAGDPRIAVPTVLATDVGDPPDVPPMFAMTFVDGESYEPLLSEPGSSAGREQIASRAIAGARMLAALHTIGASAFDGEPAFTPEQELERWTKVFASVDDDLRPPEAARCADALASTIPAASVPALLHGDWRLGNMLCAGGDVAAVIDWEIWSLGDPRTDLAWFLLMADPLHPRCVRTDSGMPREDVLRDAYEDAAGARSNDLAWFAALVRYKQAAASALLVRNARKRDPSTPPGLAVPGLLRSALERLA
jgi:aminoglycoside phosphotransferase (APT) family kinase protein